MQPVQVNHYLSSLVPALYIAGLGLYPILPGYPRINPLCGCPVSGVNYRPSKPPGETPRLRPRATNNLLPVTIGNIIGGSIFVAAIYWSVFLRRKPI